MTYYVKPHDITYTQMCIWIDENVYKEDCDDFLVFEYLYHLAKMLAYKRRFFEKSAYYDDFAIYCATKIFMRYKDDRQFEENGKIQKIKSVLNYMKSVLYAVKISFEGEFFAQNYIEKEDDIVDCNFHSALVESLNSIQVSNFKFCLDSFIETMKNFVYSLPHDSDIFIQNIYISCILSFLNSVVLSKKNEKRLLQLKKDGRLSQEHIDRLYKKERDSCVILYHLDSSFKDYIKVLVNEIRHLVSHDLSEILNDGINYESNIKNMLILSINSDLKCDDDYD
ncbi:MAG: hypothetical protein J6T10_28850 [Methanobrevibacter sp.]|nr:hypothetical protein [Methanobrevibacter sp.]